MSTQWPAGWYPDGQGNDRYWSGTEWTENVRASAGEALPGAAAAATAASGAAAAAASAAAATVSSAFGRFNDRRKQRAADKEAARAAAASLRDECAAKAGALTTSGVFGTSTVEIYENAYVRVASCGDDGVGAVPAKVKWDTPYEKLRVITLTGPGGARAQGAMTGAPSMLGSAVTGLISGGSALLKANPVMLAASAATTYAVTATAGKLILTISTDRNTHTLTNQVLNGVGIKVPNRDHCEVGALLEAAGIAVLGREADQMQREELAAAATAIPPVQETANVLPEPSLTERLRELALLHNEGILSDEEFSAAKAKVLSGM